jgi:hypothetical protein
MTQSNSTRARERVVERLADTTVIQGAPIEDATEIYRDLRISGWDLWEFIDWVRAEFGTDFSAMNASKYSPGEGGELFADDRAYRSLTVGAVLDAIANGAWRETK